MTLRTEEALQLATYADQQGQILMVGHLLLYQPAITWMRDYLATGKAGQVLHVAARRAKLGRVRHEENVWWSFAPHDVSVVLDLLGNPQVEQVQASGHAILQAGIEDKVYVDREFTRGQTAHIYCSHECAFVAAGAVVTKDVPAYAMVAGVPAKIMGWMSAYGDVLNLNSDGYAEDSQGAKYQQVSRYSVQRVG